MSHLQPSILSLCVAAVLSPVVVQAETTNQTESTNAATVVVTDKRDDQLSSKQTIDSDQIKSTPSGNGNLSDYLISNPNVRMADSDQEGFKAGEIKPSSISILGADKNQTAYMVDGIVVNNDLVPDDQVFDGSMQTVPSKSSEQAYFFDANLLNAIEVYSSNIPAKLGGFTGGAVVAETRQYSGVDGAQMSYRTTRSSWAEMQVDEHIHDVVTSGVPEGAEADFQPIYQKDFYSLAVQKSLTDDIGMVLGFSRRESNIQQTRRLTKDGQTSHEDHNRLSDNWLLNFNWTPDVSRTLEVGFRLSDYQESKYYVDSLDNTFSDDHFAIGSTIAWEQYVGKGWLKLTAAYDNFYDQRASNSNSVGVYVENGLSYEKGGWGSSQLSQENTNFAVDYNFDRLNFGDFKHAISLGASYLHTEYDFNRDHDVTKYQETVISFPGFSYVDKRTDIIKAGSANTNYSSFALYGEDEITWRNVSVRPGVRIERDDYLKNTNIAPRFAANWQAFEKTRFNFGANRYYGRSFAAMKLSDEILKINGDTTRSLTASEDLATPYSDELTVGVDQNVSNFAISAQYVKRAYKDSLQTRRIDDTNRLDQVQNQPDFNVDAYTLQVRNIVPWIVGPTQWNATLAADYLITDKAEVDRKNNPDEIVLLDGEIMTRAQMHQKINSSTEEWVVRLGLDMAIDQYNLDWGNKVYIKAPLSRADYQTDLSNGTPVYRSLDFGMHTQWDTRLRWQPTIYGAHDVYVQLDVLNVLNEVRKTDIKGGIGSEYGYYTPGRQFWLELGYQF